MEKHIENLIAGEIDPFDFWKKWRFLEGMTDESAKEASVFFTEMMSYLYFNEKKYNEFDFDFLTYTTIPIIKFAITHGGLRKVYTPEVLCNFIITTKDSLQKAISDTFNGDVDAEAEYCTMVARFFTKDIEETLKNDEI